MQDILKDMIPVVKTRINNSFSTGDYSMWDSMVIDRRKPHTYRAFTQIDNYRVCLHRFMPCSEEEAFAHPHPWPAVFMVLEGEYRHIVGVADDFDADPVLMDDRVMTAGDYCSITNPLIFHSVQPLTQTFTIMVNGPEWEQQHSQTRRTKGKDLKSFTGDQLRNHLWEIEDLLHKVKMLEV